MAAAGGALALWSLLLWLWTAAEARRLLPPLSEAQSISVCLILSGLCLFLAGLTVLRFIRRLFPLQRMAALYSRSNPADRQALEALIELEARTTPLRPFEAAVQQSYHGFFTAGNCSRLRRFPAAASSALCLSALTILLALCGGLMLFPPPLLQQAAALLSGTPAIILENPVPEVAGGDNVTLRFRFTRRTDEIAAALLQTDTGERLPLRQTSPDHAEITFYGFESPLSFHIRTPHLRSASHTLRTYQRPAPVACIFTCHPPAHTALPPEEYHAFRDTTVPEGSQITIDCQMPPGQSWQLQQLPEGTPHPACFTANDKGLALQAVYRDTAGHHALSPQFTIAVRPDQPPQIELSHPGADSCLTSGAALAICGYAQDDYRIGALAFHLRRLDGSTLTYPLVLPTSSMANSLEFAESVTLPPLAEGEILVGYATATDNRAPTPQTSSSPLIFLTATASQNASGAAASSASSPGQPTAASIADLIAESKRLLRNTWSLLQAPADETSAMRLKSDLLNHRQAVTDRAAVIAGNAGLKKLPAAMQGGFDDAATRIGQAAAAAAAGKLEETLVPQQQALAILARIHMRLQKNRRSLSAGNAGTTDAAGASEQDGSRQSDTVRPGDRTLDLAILQKARAQLLPVIGQQYALLSALRNPSSLPVTLHQQQTAAAHTVHQIAAGLGGLAGAAPLRQTLNDAGGLLERTAGHLADTRNERPSAASLAHRSLNRLETARDQLDSLLFTELQKQTGFLAETANALSEKQQEAASASRQNPQQRSDSRRQQAIQQQQLLNAAFQEMQHTLESLANAMAEISPSGSAPLRDTLSGEQAQELERTRQRTGNALRYQRYDKAAVQQQRLAGLLAQWGKRLAGIDLAAPAAGGYSIPARSSPLHHTPDTPPPPQYRLPVQEYFRKLTE